MSKFRGMNSVLQLFSQHNYSRAVDNLYSFCNVYAVYIFRILYNVYLVYTLCVVHIAYGAHIVYSVSFYRLYTLYT